MKVTLHIDSPEGRRSIPLENELSIGRTELATLVVDDPGLSKVNTTLFKDGDEVFVVDENSLNGTYLNGQQIVGPARQVFDGDQLKIGSYTSIHVTIEDELRWAHSRSAVGEVASGYSEPAASFPKASPPDPSFPSSMTSEPEQPPGGPPFVLIASIAMTMLILLFGGVAIYFLVDDSEGSGSRIGRQTPQIRSGSAIPVRVIDPLGGEDENDLDDLIALMEVAEDEIKADEVSDVKVESENEEEAALTVTAAMLADRQRKALEPRNAETGIRPAGLAVPRELFGDGVIKQKAKLREMNAKGYRQPLDFAELAEKRMNRELIEMPMATQGFYLDVGGSASDGPFTQFSFQSDAQPILTGSPKAQILSRLASNFSGQVFDLNNPGHRKEMRRRLLRMFDPSAKPILRELAEHYFAKFGRPLRVTSLTRSMDYQILLARGNANAFKVRGAGSLPPHTSGCAFDLARKHMTAEEQNYVMLKLAQMERDGKLDALIEYGVNACFHVFIYNDGNPPRM